MFSYVTCEISQLVVHFATRSASPGHLQAVGVTLMSPPCSANGIDSLVHARIHKCIRVVVNLKTHVF